MHFIYWFFFRYIFLALRSVSPHSTVTYMNTILSSPLLFRPASGCLMADLLQRMFSTTVACQHILVYVRNVFSSRFRTPGIFGVPNRILQNTWTEFFNTPPPQKKGPVLVNAGRTRSLLFTTNLGCICVAEVNFHAWYNPAPEGSNQFQTRTSQVQAVANCHTQWSARAVSNMAARTGIFQSLS